jgi:hypothetical protein
VKQSHIQFTMYFYISNNPHSCELLIILLILYDKVLPPDDDMRKAMGVTNMQLRFYNMGEMKKTGLIPDEGNAMEVEEDQNGGNQNGENQNADGDAGAGGGNENGNGDPNGNAVNNGGNNLPVGVGAEDGVVGGVGEDGAVGGVNVGVVGNAVALSNQIASFLSEDQKDRIGWNTLGLQPTEEEVLQNL